MSGSRQTRASWRVAGAALLPAFALLGCAARTREPAPSLPMAAPRAEPAREGRRYQVISADSLLTVRVFRGGALASMGHNHLVASHDLAGMAYVPEDLTGASFELRFPVARLTVDEPQLRSTESSEAFPPEVPESAREGTRKNMLGPALLDAERHPEIVLKSERIEVTGPNELLAHVQVTVRDHTSSVVVPLHDEITDTGMLVSGEFPLTHAQLGLSPFSVLMGALQVQDEMKIRFQVRCAATP